MTTVNPQVLADEGMQRSLHADRNQAWRERAERWLDEQPEGRLFTADDVIDAIGLPVPDGGPADNNAVGGWINNLPRRQRTENTGRMAKSRRAEGHGNKISIWRVTTDGRYVGSGGDASAPPPQLRADVSSSPALPPLTEEEEWEAQQALRDYPQEGVVSSAGGTAPLTSAAVGEEAVSSSARSPRGELERAAEEPCETEQLGLLGEPAGKNGAYSGAA